MTNRAGKRKAEIRARYLAARRGLSREEVEAKSAAIVTRLRGIGVFQRAEWVLTYVASKDNEVDTRPLIASLLEEGRLVLVPIAGRGGVMVWSRLESLSELAPGRFGILEPREECVRLVEVSGEAVVVVPGIAFSPEGSRVGYGGGYFDRFLAGFGGVKIGLAFDCQMVGEILGEEHDVCVDGVVTETGVYGPMSRLLS